jgi:multiple sugar transport system permease protein
MRRLVLLSAKFKRKSRRVIRIVIVWLIVVVTLLPIYWIVSTSLKTPAQASQKPPILLFLPTLESYISVLVKDGFMKYFFNSLIISSITVVSAMFVGTLAAYVMARYHTGGKPLTFAVLCVQMIPPMAISLPLFITFQSLHLIDTKLGIIIAEFAFNMPFIIWIMRQFFMQIPIAIEESARIDGASVWRVFLSIMLPISMTGLVSAGIFTFFNTWNEFLIPLVIAFSNAKTATVAVTNYVTAYNILWTDVDAGTTILIIPPIIVTIFLRKYIVSGLVGDAVKG